LIGFIFSGGNTLAGFALRRFVLELDVVREVVAGLVCSGVLVAEGGDASTLFGSGVGEADNAD
jgi:hypothetical protein